MINIIVAHDEQRGIGKANSLMWNLPNELKRFKKITTGHPIIMGRKTFESLPKLLPNRKHFVITSNRDYQAPAGVIIATSLAEALVKAEEKDEEVFITGGGQIFSASLPLVEKLYITHIHNSFDAEIFFPEYVDNFPTVVFEQQQEENGLKYTFSERIP